MSRFAASSRPRRTLIFFERPEAEIDQARRELRSEVTRLFPDKTELYERIYETRSIANGLRSWD